MQSFAHSTATDRLLFNMISTTKRVNELRDCHVGDFKWSARTADFSGWLVCDGRAVSRSAFAELFDIIGTRFGAGDGSTTFNLPDCRGRVAGGVGAGNGLTARTMGAAVGTETHTLSSSEMPAHTHEGTTDVSGAHTHATNADGLTNGLTVTDGNNTRIDVDQSAGELNLDASAALSVGTAGTHAHTFTTGSAGSGAAHNNMQPTLFIGNLLIYSGVLEPVANTILVVDGTPGSHNY